MRPGQLCPGRGEVLDLSMMLERASMRPGQLCPGRHEGPRHLRSPHRGFNEAGAVMPRKGPKMAETEKARKPLQ